MKTRVEKMLEVKDDEDFIGLEEDIDTNEIESAAHELMELVKRERPKDVSRRKNKKKGYNLTKEEKRTRLREVLQCFNTGMTYNEVVEYGKRRWNCSERTVQRYITSARDIEAMPERDINEFRSDSISRCLYIYKKAILKDRQDIALSAQKEINKLLGLYPDQILQFQGSKDNPITFLVAEIAKSGLKKDDISIGAIEVEAKIED